MPLRSNNGSIKLVALPSKVTYQPLKSRFFLFFCFVLFLFVRCFYSNVSCLQVILRGKNRYISQFTLIC